MKALSVKQPWANMIAAGEKTIETRIWQTNHRGDLLIVSSKSPPIEPAGFGVAIVRLVDCRAMSKRDELRACSRLYPGAFAWVLDNVRPVKPFPVSGKLRLYEVSVPKAVRSAIRGSRRSK
jgi:hypothetical protein